MTNIRSFGSNNIYEGNWCGNPGEFLHVNKMKQSDTDEGCDVTTCWDELNKHPNIIDIHWDDVGKVCTSVASCNTGTPVGFSDSPCKEDTQPSICKGSDYTCDTNGDITKPVHDACTSYNTCDLVTDSGNPDIGWCINETAPGVYEQSCALSETACTEKGSEAIFVQSPYMCPYSTKAGSGGCGPNYSLRWYDEEGLFKCEYQDPAKWPLAYYCGGLAWNVRTVVWNRTRWPITMTPLGCTHGKTCDDFPTTIEPYDGKNYYAGSDSWSIISPACSFAAAWGPYPNPPDPDFDFYMISFDMHNDSHPYVVTHIGPEDEFFKSVKVTYKMWTDGRFEQALFFVIFYPTWEMTADDAKITN